MRDVVAALGAAYPALARRIVDETGEMRRFANVYVGIEECRRIGGLDAMAPKGVDVHVIGSIAGFDEVRAARSSWIHEGDGTPPLSAGRFRERLCRGER